MNERPAGITVLAVFYLFLGGISLIWSGFVLGIGGLSSLFGGLLGAETIAQFGTSSAWSGFLGIITAVIQIVVAFGLLAMKKWAWYLALIGVVLSVIQGLVFIFTGGLWGLICGSLGLIIPVIILIYLLSRGVKQTFQITSGE